MAPLQTLLFLFVVACIGGVFAAVGKRWRASCVCVLTAAVIFAATLALAHSLNAALDRLAAYKAAATPAAP